MKRASEVPGGFQNVVETIVEKLDGAVGVESRPGAGARFWFELPAAHPVSLS